jgi:hypothetical protein
MACSPWTPFYVIGTYRIGAFEAGVPVLIVPEPSAGWLMLAGIIAAGWWRRRRAPADAR